MPLIQLNHQSNHPKCSGNPGDVVEVDQETADLFVARGGGKIVQVEAVEAPETSDTDTESGNDSDSDQGDKEKPNAKKSAKK